MCANVTKTVGASRLKFDNAFVSLLLSCFVSSIL